MKEETAVYLYNGTSLQYKEMNWDMQQPDDLHKHDGECKKPDTEQYRKSPFTRNSRKVKSVAVEGRWVIAGDGSQKETWGDGNALYFEHYGSSRGAIG